MGDDAEYYMQLQEEEARFKFSQALGYAGRNKKPLLCWTDGYAGEIWDWEPLTKVLHVFSNLHNVSQIGSDYFLSSGIPTVENDEDWNNDEDWDDDEYASPVEADDSNEIKFVNELEFYVANSEDEATHEIIVLSQHDATLLKNEAARQKGLAKTLKEEMLAEMLEEMALFIEGDPQRNIFIFARTL
jgi:hypothetical protein